MHQPATSAQLVWPDGYDGNRDARHFARWKDDSFEAPGDKLVYEAGGFRLNLFSGWGGSYGIEASSNLVDWQRIVTFTNLQEAVEFVDDATSEGGRRFYRAVSP